MRNALAIALILALSTASAHAEDREEAARLLDRGNKLFATDEFDAALTHYRDAYAAFPSAKILFNIAEALHALSRNAEAANTYAEFLSAGSVDVNAEASLAAKKKLQTLDRALARLQLAGELTDVEVSIDVIPLGPPLDRIIRVNPGTHDILATRPDQQRFETRIDARADTLTTVRIDFGVAAVDPTPPLAAAPTPPPPPVEPSKPALDPPMKTESKAETGHVAPWWLWAAIGAVVVLGATAAVVAASGGDDTVPSGELPSTSTGDWLPRE